MRRVERQEHDLRRRQRLSGSSSSPQECAAQAERPPLVATHPPACLRLEQLRTRLPLARRVAMTS
jgi:hypothetical protein